MDGIEIFVIRLTRNTGPGLRYTDIGNTDLEMYLFDLPKTSNSFAVCPIGCRKRKYTLSIGDHNVAGGYVEYSAKIHRVGKVVSPATAKIAATDDLPLRDNFNEPAGRRSSRCSWNMKRICRLNNSANIDQYIGLALPGKSVAMNSHTRRHGQFSFHTCWLQCDRVIACLCRFIFLAKGVR